MATSGITHRAQARVVCALFAVVIVTDQATKWFAWRHVPTVLINQGGFIALGHGVRAWFAAPTAGAVANVVGALLVAAGLAVLLRRPRRPPVLVGGGLLAAGWTSNLLDRFGLHGWTAPGSVRGVVDFIPTGTQSCANLADAFIATGVVVLGLAAVRKAAPPALR
jgi:lipoprotein signal peptidase